MPKGAPSLWLPKVHGHRLPARQEMRRAQQRLEDVAEDGVLATHGHRPVAGAARPSSPTGWSPLPDPWPEVHRCAATEVDHVVADAPRRR